jgi:hypothetical protein
MGMSGAVIMRVNQDVISQDREYFRHGFIAANPMMGFKVWRTRGDLLSSCNDEALRFGVFHRVGKSWELDHLSSMKKLRGTSETIAGQDFRAPTWMSHNM